ncbi:transposase [Burkholderia ubonensis]|uniref:transposase n=1 Tax=Burkholderia ubonensis TaxID=101571 RepID=UPI0039F5B98C
MVRFIDSLLVEGDGRPTVIVLDNASIHHSIDAATRERWLIDHKAHLFYLPSCSPELNLIEIVWRHLKYRWRRFITWTATASSFKLVSREHLTELVFSRVVIEIRDRLSSFKGYHIPEQIT